MKKYFIFLIILWLYSFCSFSQENPDVYTNKDFIVWGKEELRWEDFRGPILSTEYDAGTYGGFSYYYDKNGKLFWFAYFSKNKSWRKGESKDVLEHEKYHFNIVELHARKLRKAIIENKLSMNNVKTINKYIDKIWAECESMQNEYDQKTNHSKNKKLQAIWEVKINKALNDLKFYSVIAVN